MNLKKVHRIVRRIWVLAGLSFFAWMVWSFQAHHLPAGVLTSTDDVRVSELEGSIRFLPAGDHRGAGLIFLPGGMVQPTAYAPMARRLAERGFPVVIVRLPFRTAPRQSMEEQVRERARSAQLSAPGVAWVLGGHSRGAAIVTRLMHRSADNYRGLALVATTHPRVDLRSLPIPVLKIGGTRDCVAQQNDAENNAFNLPEQTEWSWIPGANHAQFGYYGFQLGDCRAEISRAEQQDALVGLLSDFLGSVEGT